jgi:ribosomal protein L11 methyltransferase
VGLTPGRARGSSWAYRVPGTAMEVLSDALLLAGAEPAGLSEDGGVATAWFAERPADPLPLAGSWEEVPDTDWAEGWKAWLRPVSVGRITVVPPWLAPGGPVVGGDGPLTLVVEPGLAFGTGHHETTAGCLGALQELDLVGRRVADVGTGTAVLALGAAALGAAQVEAVDVDPEAVAVARANVAAHGLQDRVRVAAGSCEVVRGPVDVVVANLITDQLRPLAPALAALLHPGGALVAGGVAVGREHEVEAALAAAGVHVHDVRPGREWALLLGRRPA